VATKNKAERGDAWSQIADRSPPPSTFQSPGGGGGGGKIGRSGKRAAAVPYPTGIAAPRSIRPSRGDNVEFCGFPNKLSKWMCGGMLERAARCGLRTALERLQLSVHTRPVVRKGTAAWGVA